MIKNILTFFTVLASTLAHSTTWAEPNLSPAPYQSPFEEDSKFDEEAAVNRMTDITTALAERYGVYVLIGETVVNAVSVLSITEIESQTLTDTVRPLLLEYLHLGQQIQEVDNRRNIIVPNRNDLDLLVTMSRTYILVIDSVIEERKTESSQSTPPQKQKLEKPEPAIENLQLEQTI